MEVPALEKLFDAKLETVNSKLDNILAQTTKTNGRVSKLEDWQGLREPLLDSLAEEAKDNKERKRDFVWEGMKYVCFAIISFVGSIFIVHVLHLTL